MIRTPRISILSAAAILATSCISLRAADPGAKPAPAPKPATATPEDAVRTFLKAMITADKSLGESCSLPAIGRDTLWRKNPDPKKATPNNPPPAAPPISRFKVGETFQLSKRQSITFDDVMINADRQQMHVETMPTPIEVVRQPDGNWLVDPGAMIAARYAAARAAVPHAATQPSTPPKPDYSSPEATFKTFVEQLHAGDLAGANACFHDVTDLDRKYMDATLHVTILSRQLLAALFAHMPDAAKGLPPDPVEAMEDLYVGAPIQITQDSAWITPHAASPAGGREGMPLQKINGEWKFDADQTYHIEAQGRAAAAQAEMVNNQRTAELLEPIVRDINSGKLKTFAEVRARFNGKPASSP